MATSTDSRTDAPRESDHEEPTIESRVGLRYTLSQIKSDPTALAGLVIVGLMTSVAILTFIDAELLDYWFANTFWVNPRNDPNTIETLLPPFFTENVYGQGTMAHPLGTDHRGRDILVRLVYGTKVAIQVAFVATFIGLLGGTVVGAVAGYYGGWIDDVLMRGVETLYAIPFLVLVIAFITAFAPRRQGTLLFAMIGVGIASIPAFARLIRSRVLSVREEDYIEAARAAGVRDRNIIARHVIPNSFAPVLVQATLQVGYSILIVAGLSFLGFGVQPPEPSWGQMLSQSRNYMIEDWWFSLWPGLAILVTVIGFNLVGDGLRDALDPRINN